jgi:DNA mismatch endonuclease (patch repair protein)
VSGSGRPRSATRRRRVASEASSSASSAGVRSRMQLQRTRDTDPELAVRRLLHAQGLRYRVDQAPIRNLRRRADVVFGPAKVAVFVDGCFWHGCPDHSRARTVANPEYWSDKITRNRARDEDTDTRLKSMGWLVVRVWEHDDPVEVAARIAGLVALRRRNESE